MLTNSLASNDEPVVHTGYARYRADLLRGRRRSVRAQPRRASIANKRLMFPGMSLGRLHAKTAVIDRSLVFIGSMNLDPRSASKNTELGIIAECPRAREGSAARDPHQQAAKRVPPALRGRRASPSSGSTMDDDDEVVLVVEPDTSLFTRLQNMLLGPFVPEQQL